MDTLLGAIIIVFIVLEIHRAFHVSLSYLDCCFINAKVQSSVRTYIVPRIGRISHMLAFGIVIVEVQII